MTPSSPDDLRLYEQFVRYWDGTLPPDAGAELEQRLIDDPAAREWFQLFALHAVAAADLPLSVPLEPACPRDQTPGPMPRVAAPATPFPDPAIPGKAGRGWSRRGVLGLFGAGAAAATTIGILSRRLITEEPPVAPRLHLRDARGTVTVSDKDGRGLPTDQPVPPGATVSTHGVGSSVILSYPDGTTVALTGDSVVTLAGEARRVRIQQGAVSAAVPPQQAGLEPFTLLTPLVTLAGLNGVLLTLGEGARATEVEVYQGTAAAARPNGEPMDVVREGEVLTVRSNGDHRKQLVAPVPDRFAWDLTKPLPTGWHIGHRELTLDGPVVLPEPWPDPYHNYTVMNQIRSDGQWTRGFFRLARDSEIHVRYWVDRPGPSQVCICVRTPKTPSSPTGVVECNGAFANARPREWQWLKVRAGDMLNNKEAPKFNAPWVGFLVIFNTFEEDLGLKVAEFRVTRPGTSAL